MHGVGFYFIRRLQDRRLLTDNLGDDRQQKVKFKSQCRKYPTSVPFRGLVSWNV